MGQKRTLAPFLALRRTAPKRALSNARDVEEGKFRRRDYKLRRLAT